MNKKIEEQVKKYTEAKVIDIEKVLGLGGVVFEEIKNVNGEIKIIPHIALPVTIKYSKILREKIIEIEKLGEQYEKEIADVKDVNKIREINEEYLEKLNDLRLDIAILCFNRTEQTTKEELSSWLTDQMLNDIVQVASGISIPPKQ